MLKDFAKTSPVTFFSLPIIIIGLLVLSYFLYSTLLTNQINAKSEYLDRQLDITIDRVYQQVNEFRSEIPFLAEVDHFENVFDTQDDGSKKLRFRLKRLMNRYSQFVDTLYIYDTSRFYFIGIEDNGISEEFGDLSDIDLPLQFTNVTKIIHIKGSKSLAIIPVNWGKRKKVYLAALIDVVNLIKYESSSQFIGEKGFKMIFSENMGFVEAERGEKAVGEFLLPQYHKKMIINSLLDSQEGSLLHQLKQQGVVFLTVYSPFRIFDERYGLIFSVSEEDFIGPIKNKLLIIFCSFFLIIAIIIVVFIFNLRDIAKNNDELSQSRDELSKTLTQQSLLLENSDSFTYAYNRARELVYASGNIESITGYTKEEWVSNIDTIVTDHPMNEAPRQDLYAIPKTGEGKRVFRMEIAHKNGQKRILHFFEKPHYTQDKFELVVGTARDITEAYYSRKNLQRALSMLQSQQEASVDGLLVADEDFKIVSHNKRFLDMFSMTGNLELGSDVFEVLHEVASFCDKKETMRNFNGQVTTHPIIDIHDELSMINGRHYEFYTAPVRSTGDEIFGRIWMFRDVTTRKNEIEELKQAKKKADQGAKEKENFLSTMSHEIRTPLNAIVGFTNLLLQEKPREDQIGQLEPLKYSADSLLNLLNDILDINKIESGNIQFEKANFDLRVLLEKAKKIFEVSAVDKNLELTVDVDSQIPKVLVGDYNRLNQVIFNLLSNAIKFTEEGQVRIKAILKDSFENDSLIRFKIIDTGIGIPVEKQDLIFNSFSQADSDTTRKYGGTGLGLAISKQLVDLQGGHLGLESEVGKGSTFYFDLRFEHGEPENEASEAVKKQEEDLDGMHILVVEDNPFNQKVLERFLLNWKAQVSIANSGVLALEKVGAKDIQVVLMDLQMPDMDGYQTASAIRNLDGAYFSKLPIIAMSADTLGEVKSRVEQHGMNDYVSKPFDPSTLLAKLIQYKN
ncbi:MAG: response regulator [Flavobacteriales bacterium]|nr:response regulator [Flavobacteriales bacterium]